MNLWKERNWTAMLLQEIKKPFNSPDFLFELKFDGIRAIIFASNEKIMIQSRSQKDLTSKFPELQDIKKIVNHNVIFDGEIVVFENNKCSFKAVQERVRLKNNFKIESYSKEKSVVFVAFDILFENNKELVNMPLIKRKKVLNKYKNNSVFIKNKSIDTFGIDFFNKIKELDLEGIVAKRKDSIYEINVRTNHWLKIKNWKQDIFFIGGFVEKEKTPVISLLLLEKIQNKFYFVGKVSMSKKYNLYKKLKQLKPQLKSSFEGQIEDEATFVNIKYKCLVSYIEKTSNNYLRQPIFNKEVK